jgi:hypothetical protein
VVVAPHAHANLSLNLSGKMWVAHTHLSVTCLHGDALGLELLDLDLDELDVLLSVDRDFLQHSGLADTKDIGLFGSFRSCLLGRIVKSAKGLNVCQISRTYGCSSLQ